MAEKSSETLPAPRGSASPSVPSLPAAPSPPLVESTVGTFGGIGTLYEVLTKPEIDRIHTLFSQKLPLEWIAIKPTGEIYLPQVFYRRMLLEAFGPGNWGMRPLAEYKMPKATDAGNKVQVIWPMELIAYGRVLALGIGEASYFKNSQRGSLATAAESAHSDAITRACKTLGIATECWDPVFARWFVEEYCVRVWVTNYQGKKEMQWRRKDSPPLPGEKAEAPMDERPGQVIDRPESIDEPVGAGKAPTREPGEDDGAPEERQEDMARELFDLDTTARAREQRADDPRDRTSPYIVQDDIKTLMAVCDQYGVTEEKLKQYLATQYHCQSRLQIRRVWFPAIVDWVKHHLPEPEPEPKPTRRSHPRTVRR